MKTKRFESYVSHVLPMLALIIILLYGEGCTYNPTEPTRLLDSTKGKDTTAGSTGDTLRKADVVLVAPERMFVGTDAVVSLAGQDIRQWIDTSRFKYRNYSFKGALRLGASVIRVEGVSYDSVKKISKIHFRVSPALYTQQKAFFTLNNADSSCTWKANAVTAVDYLASPIVKSVRMTSSGVYMVLRTETVTDTVDLAPYLLYRSVGGVRDTIYLNEYDLLFDEERVADVGAPFVRSGRMSMRITRAGDDLTIQARYSSGYSASSGPPHSSRTESDSSNVTIGPLPFSAKSIPATIVLDASQIRRFVKAVYWASMHGTGYIGRGQFSSGSSLTTTESIIVEPDARLTIIVE